MLAEAIRIMQDRFDELEYVELIVALEELADALYQAGVLKRAANFTGKQRGSGLEEKTSRESNWRANEAEQGASADRRHALSAFRLNRRTGRLVRKEVAMSQQTAFADVLDAAEQLDVEAQAELVAV